jgi:type IV secretion system protein VirB10
MAENIALSEEKEKLVAGKPRRNIYVVLVGMALVFTIGFAIFDQYNKSGETENDKEVANKLKVDESNSKSLSIEDMTKKVEREKPKDVRESEEVARLKQDLEKEKRKSLNQLNSAQVNKSSDSTNIDANEANSAYDNEKTRHVDAVSTSAIYSASSNSVSKKQPSDIDDEITKLYKEQNERLMNLGNVSIPNDSEITKADIPVTLKQDKDEQWLKNQSKLDATHQPIKVSKGSYPDKTIYESTVIPVVVSQVTSSDFPGKFKVATTRPIYSKSGKELLSKGSTILGMANTDVRPGQQRVQAAFYRIITPKGDSIYLPGMQGVDEEGIIGIKGDVNNHYFKMFASSFGIAFIQSLMTKNDSSVNVNNPSGSVSITTGAIETLGDVARTNLERNKTIPPTITLLPGMEFNITVVKDIVIDVE